MELSCQSTLDTTEVAPDAVECFAPSTGIQIAYRHENHLGVAFLHWLCEKCFGGIEKIYNCRTRHINMAILSTLDCATFDIYRKFLFTEITVHLFLAAIVRMTGAGHATCNSNCRT